jgi:hypothetical protein
MGWLVCSYSDFIFLNFRYEELIKEEKTTNNELNAISRKIDTWALGNSETEKAFRAVSSKVLVGTVTPSSLPEEVVEFEKFLQQTGGRQGGWDDYDHQNFVKVRNKHKGKPAFVGELLEHLPGRTQDEVQQHEKWYQKFLALEERKKEVIIIHYMFLCRRHCATLLTVDGLCSNPISENMELRVGKLSNFTQVMDL